MTEKKRFLILIWLVMVTGVMAGPRILLGSYGGNDLMILGSDGTVEWSLPGMSKVTDIAYLPNGHILYAHTDGITLIAPDYVRKKGGETVFSWKVPPQSSLSDNKMLATKEQKGETHTCQPLPDGNILTGVSYNGTSYIVEINRKTGVEKKIVLKGYGSRHGSFRNIRKTPKGTYLLSRISGTKIGLEVDGKGKILREFAGARYVLIRLENGNTLISGTDDHRIFEIDPDGKTVWEVREKDIAGMSLAATAGLQRLPNGNTVIASWGGHGDLKSPAVIEITRDKKLVWQTPPTVKNRVLSLHVLDKDVLAKPQLR